jgi:hypothetical protein
MKKLLLAAAMLAAAPALPAHAMNCESDTITEKSDDSDIIKTMSGHIYEVAEINRIDTQLWLPTEDLLVCDAYGNQATMIDTDNTSDGKVDVTRLK